MTDRPDTHARVIRSVGVAAGRSTASSPDGWRAHRLLREEHLCHRLPMPRSTTLQPAYLGLPTDTIAMFDGAGVLQAFIVLRRFLYLPQAAPLPATVANAAVGLPLHDVVSLPPARPGSALGEAVVAAIRMSSSFTRLGGRQLELYFRRDLWDPADPAPWWSDGVPDADRAGSPAERFVAGRDASAGAGR